MSIFTSIFTRLKLLIGKSRATRQSSLPRSGTSFHGVYTCPVCNIRTVIVDFKILRNEPGVTKQYVILEECPQCHLQWEENRISNRLKHGVRHVSEITDGSKVTGFTNVPDYIEKDHPSLLDNRRGSI